MSTTPPSPRRPLTERRKAATRLEIARAAAELFTEHGPDATSAEEIADRAGVALRTFYRYFRNKHDAVGPLLAVGAERWRALLAATGPGTPLPEALERTLAEALAVPVGGTAEGLRRTRALLRTALRDPALRAVWYRVNQESEERLVPVLARLAGPDSDPLELRLTAAVAVDALRIGLELWAAPDAPPGAAGAGTGSPAGPALRCLRELSGGLRPLAPVTPAAR
ncbi:TetR family transcriptional regulator [Streptomyces tirandamycinicus]|uniref:TetR family transcriptional regulator n=1 Tax=Streptomyces tirandamycinicus TaxID=2174846 RepID=UPI002271FC15|nr:TetR family transcriptional regulator [Streptomyces tirandamycinicus]MCY0983617.1 TetR family transcriptional regulator [Streptomyces tirandamycinicus]